ncbi:MAG TPA: hypothetical protein VFL80_04730 [Thermoanaerobaculia bacterium]|nr:hypothetical protein [Thermoanaerobaculia bacterium]
MLSRVVEQVKETAGNIGHTVTSILPGGGGSHETGGSTQGGSQSGSSNQSDL